MAFTENSLPGDQLYDETNDEDLVESEEMVLETDPWSGFKIVGDNFDITVKPRHMTFDHQTKSLHYFHNYALKDRVDFSAHSSTPTIIHPLEFCKDKFLPSSEDQDAIENNMAILISRELVKYMPFFKQHFQSCIKWHIEHTFSSEMRQKSVVVSICNCIQLVCMHTCMK